MVNNAYIQDNKRCLTPIYKNGEAYSFYINFDKPISDPDFELFALGVFDGDTMLAGGIPGLAQHFMEGSDILYNIYCDFNFPVVPMGYYTFCIYNQETDAIMCRSNVIIANRPDYEDAANWIQYRNKSDIYNIYYSTLPDFKNRFRLLLNQVDRQYEVDRVQYRNVTNRKFRNVKSYRDKVVVIESYFFDDEAHEAITAVHEHNEIYINSGLYTPKSGYTIANRPQSLLNKGSLEMYELDANAINIDFNEFLYFDTSETGDSQYNVTGNAGVLTQMYFGFNRIFPTEGMPNSMEIDVNGQMILLINFLGDYLGKPFKIYNYYGFYFEGLFTNGVLNYTI